MSRERDNIKEIDSAIDILINNGTLESFRKIEKTGDKGKIIDVTYHLKSSIKFESIMKLSNARLNNAYLKNSPE